MTGKSLIDIAHFLKTDGLKFTNPQQMIPHLVIEHSEVKKGFGFIAYQGARFDGHLFIPKAIKQGASLIICEREILTGVDSIDVIIIPGIQKNLASLACWFYPLVESHIMAVTGTNGKTSITCLYAQMANLLNRPCGVLGTMGNGIWPNLIQSDRTTQNSLTLWRNLEKITKQTKEIAMEISSHALVQERVKGLKLSQVIWSNLSHDHLDYHRVIEAYFEAKYKLFSEFSYEHAIINLDNQWGQLLYDRLKSKNTKERKVIYTYSTKTKAADLFLEVLMKKAIGYRVCLHFLEQTQITELNLVGQFNLENVAAVILAFLLKGFSLRLIAPRLSQLKPVRGRLEIIKKDQKPFTVIDFAHTPDALEKTLITVRAQMKQGQKLWCVFGCGGDRDASKRPVMASLAEKLPDRIVVTSDNPRTESQQGIFNDMEEGFSHSKPIIFIEDRKEAIFYALNQASENDWILIAGKGHETYQEINGVKYPFNEKEIIQVL